MATPKTPPDQTVTTSSRQWDEEVAIADADHPLPRHPIVYEFAGGRRNFVDKNPQ